MSVDSFRTSGNSPGTGSAGLARPAAFVAPAGIPPAVSSAPHLVAGSLCASHVVDFMPTHAEAL